MKAGRDDMQRSRELDALVAEKVMGLHPCSDPIGRCDAAKMTPCQCWGTPDRNGVVSGGELASYSTDISAAWLVVEKLRGDGFGIIFNDTMGQYRGRFWRYDRSDGWDIDAWIIRPDTKFTVWATTAPLAICLAALKAVGVDVDGPK